VHEGAECRSRTAGWRWRGSGRGLRTIGAVQDRDRHHGVDGTIHREKKRVGRFEERPAEVVGLAVSLPRDGLVDDVTGIEQACPENLAGVGRAAAASVIKEVCGVDRRVVFDRSPVIDREYGVIASPREAVHAKSSDPAGVVLIEPSPAVGDLDESRSRDRIPTRCC